MNEYTTQTCSKCGTEFPLTEEYFYRRAGTSTGFRRDCKDCVKGRNNRYYHANTEKASARKKAFYYANLERVLEQKRDYYARNKERIIEQHREYVAVNRDRLKAYYKDYYQRNHERYSAQARLRYLSDSKPFKEKADRWRAENRERSRINARRREHRRRALEKNAPTDFTVDDHQHMMEYFGHRCAVCGRTADLFTVLSVDHWIPISKGGGTTRDNLVPLCHTKQGCSNGVVSCNGSKHNKLPNVWLVERYGKRKAKEIANRIQMYFDSLK